MFISTLDLVRSLIFKQYSCHPSQGFMSIFIQLYRIRQENNRYE